MSDTCLTIRRVVSVDYAKIIANLEKRVMRIEENFDKQDLRSQVVELSLNFHKYLLESSQPWAVGSK